MLTDDAIKATNIQEEMKVTASQFANVSNAYYNTPRRRIINWITDILIMVMAWSLGMWTLFVFEFLAELASYWLVKESERSVMILSSKIRQFENA